MATVTATEARQESFKLTWNTVREFVAQEVTKQYKTPADGVLDTTIVAAPSAIMEAAVTHFRLREMTIPQRVLSVRELTDLIWVNIEPY